MNPTKSNKKKKKYLFSHDQYRFVRNLNRFWDVRNGQIVLNPLIKENDAVCLELVQAGYLETITIQGQRFYVPTSKLTNYLDTL